MAEEGVGGWLIGWQGVGARGFGWGHMRAKCLFQGWPVCLRAGGTQQDFGHDQNYHTKHREVLQRVSHATAAHYS